MKKNKLLKNLKIGDLVAYRGRHGMVLRGPDEDLLYTVVFDDAKEPKELMEPRKDLDKLIDAELSFEDFLDVILKFRGCNRATIKDMVDIRKCIGQKTADLEERLAQAAGGQRDKVNQGEVQHMARKLEESLLSSLQELRLLERGLPTPHAQSLPTLVVQPAKHENVIVFGGLVRAQPDDPVRAHTEEHIGDLGGGDGSMEKVRNWRLQQLEDSGSSMLDTISKLRRRLHDEQFPGGSSARTGQRPSSKGRGGFEVVQHRGLRLAVARLESVLLTSWAEELERARAVVPQPSANPSPPPQLVQETAVQASPSGQSSGHAKNSTAGLSRLYDQLQARLSDLRKSPPS